MRTKRFILTWFLCISLLLSTAVMGHAFSSILAFGDSLSDNGTYGMYADAAAYTSPYDGFGFSRFSNGPVWVEYLAQRYELSLLDMAYGGATSGYDNPAAGLGYTGLQWQVNTYLSAPGTTSGSTLITVWAGGNDLLNYASNPSLYNPATAAANVALAIQALINDGGRNFIVPNLTWNAIDPALLAGAMAWMAPFNYYLAQGLQPLDAIPGVNIYEIDLTQLYYAGLNPDGSFKNPGDEEGPFARWDSVHPTTQGHLQIANYVAGQVPEPLSIILLIIGFAGLAGIRRMKL